MADNHYWVEPNSPSVIWKIIKTNEQADRGSTLVASELKMKKEYLDEIRTTKRHNLHNAQHVVFCCAL